MLRHRPFVVWGEGIKMAFEGCRRQFLCIFSLPYGIIFVLLQRRI